MKERAETREGLDGRSSIIDVRGLVRLGVLLAMVLAFPGCKETEEKKSVESVVAKILEEEAQRVRDLASDKYYGEPNSNLPDYRYLTRNFPIPRHITNRDIFDAATLHLRLVFMNYKTREYTEFVGPLLTELHNVGTRIAAIERDKSSYQDILTRLRDDIRRTESNVNSGNFLSGDPRLQRLKDQLNSMRTERAKIEALCASEVDWPQPQYQQTEYPPGSDQLVDRFVPNPGQKVRIDLYAYQGWLSGQAAFHQRQLAVYKKEVESLAYHRNRMVKELVTEEPALKPRIDIEFVRIDQQGRTAAEGIIFRRTDKSRPVPGLVDNSASEDDYFKPATNTGAADFDRKARLLPDGYFQPNTNNGLDDLDRAIQALPP